MIPLPHVVQMRSRYLRLKTKVGSIMSLLSIPSGPGWQRLDDGLVEREEYDGEGIGAVRG